MSDHLQDTLDALQRGDFPPCPWCGVNYLTCHQDETQQVWFAHEWKCGTLLSNTQDWTDSKDCRQELTLPRFLRDAECYERALATLRADNDAHRQIAEGASKALDMLRADCAKLREACVKAVNLLAEGQCTAENREYCYCCRAFELLRSALGERAAREARGEQNNTPQNAAEQETR